MAREPLAKAGMVMFAPVSTSASLSSSVAKDEAKRSLFRAIPNDDAQAAALIAYLKRSKVRRLALIDDGGLYGRGLASGVARLISKRGGGIRVVVRRRADRDGRGHRALVAAVARHRPHAVLFAGSQSSAAAPLFREIHRRIPRALIFGGDALAHASFARRIGAAQKVVRLTRPAAHVSPRNRRARALGKDPDKVAVFAYDGMSYLLRAIRQSDAADRERPADARAAVRDAVFSGRLQWGLAGPWKVKRNGDSSHVAFDAIQLANGRVFDPFAIALRRMDLSNPKREVTPGVPERRRAS